MNDELRRAISIAQTVHDRNGGPANNTAVAIGALIRAVTILAGERSTSREEAIKVYGPQPSGISGQLNEGLVERLAHKFLQPYRERIAELESDRKNLLTRIDAAEATSLLPLVQENERLMGVLIAIAGPGPRDTAPERAIESAKHNSEIILSMISESQRDLEAMTKIRVERETLAARVVELEKQLATLNDWAAICGGKMPTVDGKTPGQVDYEGYTAARFGACADNFTPWHRLADDFQRFNEAGAQSVLRVHGRVMAKQAASDILRRVRDRLMPTARSEHYNINTRTIQEAFDEELAKLSTEPPSVVAKPKFFFNENELRGSYFCTDFPFRPHLHVGRDIEFDDIPRLLKLGLKDVIEVRVVERAER